MAESCNIESWKLRYKKKLQKFKKKNVYLISLLNFFNSLNSAIDEAQ